MSRPKVIINGAMSVDGKTALPDGGQLRLSSDEDMARVYRLRHESDAVLVGVETVLSDDPKLTVKEKYVANPRQPLRVILDSNCRVPENALIFNKAAETIIFTKKTEHYSFDVSHVCIQKVDVDSNGYLDLTIILARLYEKGIRQLLVEGGGRVIWSFISQHLIDRLYVYLAPVIIGGQGTPVFADGKGKTVFDENIGLTLMDVKQVGEGLLLEYIPKLVSL